MRKKVSVVARVCVALTSLSLATGASDCAPPDAPADAVLQATLVVKDELGQPVGGANFALNGAALGASDNAGRLTVSLRGHESSRVVLDPSCPEGTHLEGDAPNIALRPIAASDAQRTARGVEVAVRCASDLRKAALVVNTNGRAGLPVLVQGVERARTGADGLSHLLLPLEPKEEVQVTIDTSGVPGLKPERPSRVFAMGPTDSLFLFNQAFTDPAPPPVAKKKRKVAHDVPIQEPPAAPAADEAPYRLN